MLYFSDSPGSPTVVNFKPNWVGKIRPEYFDKIHEENFCSLRVLGDLSNLSTIVYLAPDLVIFNAEILLTNKCSPSELMTTLELLSRLAGSNKKYTVALGVNANTPSSLIKECKRAGMQGIVPSNDWDVDETLTATKKLLGGESYWPNHIIEKLPGAVIRSRRASEEIQLTPRQQEILDLICRRGASNKKIAQILNISESTVKVHVSAILKSYRVRNRTQLALSGIQTMSV